MVLSPLRIAGLVLAAALTCGWASMAFAQTPAVPQPMSSGSHVDEDLPWSGSAGGMMPRSGSMLRANFVGGKGVGFDSSYLTLGLFQPFWMDGQSLWYFDAQGLLIGKTFEDKTGLSGGANVGVGYRAPSPWNCNTIWGAYLFYDYSDVYRNSYSQLGVGGEVLGDDWDLRSNFYFPVDKTSNLVSLSPMTGPFYRQYNMYFTQTEVTERSFWGFDAEVGHRLYGHPDAMNIRGYVGTYYYENWDVEGPQFWGIYGRVQMHLLPDVWANVTVSNDDMFGTTASAQLTWLFPVCGKRIQCISSLPDCGPCGGGCGPSAPPGRLVQPVRRNPNIVVRDVTRTIETIATDPLTGLPISILHADSNAPPGGDGTFENPFNTLAATEAEAASGNYDIILAHADSVFTGEQITLPADVRFLGEGIDHLVDTEQAGTILLPRATAGTALPIIDQAPGNAIEVASNDEVSGFTITDPAAAGIFADNVAGPVNINRNSITGGVNGINILNSTGTFDVTETTIDGTSGTAFNVDGGAPIVNSSADITNSSGRIIAVQNTTGGTVTFQGGTLLDNGGAGILVSNNAGAVKIVGATLNNSVANAVDILNSSGAIDLQNVAINSPLGHGVNILNSNAKITGFTINTPAIDGIIVTSLNTNRTVALTGNTINGAGAIGIELNASGTGRLDASVTGNTISSLGNAFDAETTGAGGPLVLAFDNNTMTSTTGAGARITGAGGGPLTITSFLNDVVTDAATGGILVDSVAFDASPTVPGVQTVQGGVSTIGAPGNRVTGDGLRLNNVSGGLSYTNLEIYDENGTGLFVDGAGVGPAGFALAASNGKVDTLGGPALSLVDVTLNTTFASVLSTNSTSNGVFLDRTGGTFKSTSTTVTQPKNNGIVVQNSPNLIADFGTTTVTGAGVNPTDVGSGVVLTNNPGGKFTFGTLNITTDYGAGFVANNSGTVNMLTPGSVTANGGPAVDIENTSGQTNGVSGWTFNNLVSNNSTTNGLRLIDLPDPFTATGTTTINNAAGTSIEIGGTTAATFGTTNITNRQGRGIYLHDTSNNIVFGTTTISGTGGVQPGVEMLNSTGGAATIAQLTINAPGGKGVVLTNNAGSFAVTGPTLITQPQGTAIEINGGTGGATFGTVTVNQRFGAGIDISGGDQLVTIGPTVINNPNGALGTVLNVDNTVGGKVSVASLTADLNNALGNGVTLVDNAGIVEILGGMVQNASGTALLISGGDEDVTFGAAINNHVGRSVDISGRMDGLVNITGAVTDLGTGTGIRIAGSTGPNVINFAAKTTLGSSANRLTGDTALVIDGNGMAPDTAIVNFANLDIFTDGKQGLIAQNGGTLNITTGRINTTGAGATGLTLDAIDSKITLAQIDVDNIGPGAEAVVLRDLTGFFTMTGTTTLGATGTIGRGIHVDGGDASITFATTNISNRTLDGVLVENTQGTLDFGSTTVNGVGSPVSAGVAVVDTVAGAVNFSSINVGPNSGAGFLAQNNDANIVVAGTATITGSSTFGIRVNGGNGNITLGGVNVTNSAGTGLGVTNLNGTLAIAGGSINTSNGTAVDISNSLIDVTLTSVTDTNGQAIRLMNDTGNFAVTGTVTQNAGTGAAVRVNGGNTNVTLANVALNNTSGIGFDVDNSLGLFKVSGGTINNSGGQAIRIRDTSIDVTLATVSANGGVNGIELRNTPGQFTITTGGLVQNSGGSGVRLDNAENVSITGLKTSNTGGFGFELINGTANTTLNNVNVTGAAFAGIFANQTSSLAINTATVNVGVDVIALEVDASNNVNVTGGAYSSGSSWATAYFNDVTDASVQNVTLNNSGVETPPALPANLLLLDVNNFIVRRNTMNNAASGVAVASITKDVSVTIEANMINGATLNDVYVEAGAGTTLALITGPITTPPDSNVNNITTHLGAEFTDGSTGGTITGQIQINGTAYP